MTHSIRCLSTVLLTLICVFSARAQQDAQFTQYMFNTLFYNPGYAGVEGVTNFTLIHRTQWAGFTTSFDGAGGNPQSQVLSMSTPLYRFNSGVGVHIVNDNLGPQNNLEAQVSLAYHFKIQEAKLSVGIKTGIFSQTLDFGQYRPIRPDDPLLINKAGKESQIRPDLGFGVFYQAEKYFFGASVNHLLKSQFDFGIDEQRNALENHMVFTGGYHYEVGYNLVITPSFLVKTDLNVTSFDLGALATYNERMWGGLSFRQSEAAIVMLGYSMLKDNALKAGYAFDYVIQDQDAKKPTSHEIMLSYTLPVGIYGGRKIIRTPRFRH